MTRSPTPPDRPPRSWRWLAAVGLLALATTAWADPKDDARRHFLVGLEAAERGDYEGAVEAFLRAQAAIPHPATVYNIAKAYEDGGQPAEALEWFRTYARSYPSRADEVAEDIARLERRFTPTTPAVDPGAPPAAVRSDEVARIREALSDLQAMVDALGEGAVAPQPAAPTDDAEPPARPIDPAAALDAEERGEAPRRPRPPERADEPTDARGFQTDPFGEVVVTASRYGQDPLDAPSSVTILSGDDLRASGATTIWDALRRVVGVEVASMSSSTPYLGIRGFNGELTNKVLWLVDGRSIYLDFIASPLPINLPVVLDEIERVEIIRGPGSAVYGANAVTGVVNIITREPGEGPTATARASAGAPSLLDLAAVASGRIDRTAYRISAGYLQQGRWAKETDATEGDRFRTFQEDQDLAEQRFQANARLDHRFLDRGLVSVSGGFVQGTSEYYSIGELGSYGLRGRAHYLRGDLSYGPGHLRVFWNRIDGFTAPWIESRELPRDLAADVQNDVVDVEGEANTLVEVGETTHRLNAGGGYRYKRIQFDYLQGDFERPWIEHHGKVFANYQFGWRWLGVAASLRVDMHPLVAIQRTISPRGALIFRVAPKTSIRTSVGTAYRAMNQLESYMDLELNTTADGYYVRYFGGETNPDGTGLVPERVLNVEVAAHDESSRFHRLDAAVYWNRVNDLIGLASVNPVVAPVDDGRNGIEFGRSGWRNFSELTYDAIGGEVAVDLFPVDGLDVFANTSVQRTLERGPEITVPERSSSLVRGSLGATWRTPVRLDVSASAHFYSPQTWRLRQFDDRGSIEIVERDVPFRALVSARIAGRPFLDPDIELGLTVWNPAGFVNPVREHPEGQPVGGRVFGTVRVEFD